MDNNQIDQIIIGVLENDGKIEASKELYEKIKGGYFMKSAPRGKAVMKAVACFVIGLMLVCGGVLVVSKDARAFASRVGNSIVSLFYYEKEGDKFVRKEISSEKGCITVSGKKEYTREQITSLLNFKIKIPERICGKEVISRNLGIVLNKKIPIKDLEPIKSTVDKAIEDNAAFDSLKDFRPTRLVTMKFGDYVLDIEKGPRDGGFFMAKYKVEKDPAGFEYQYYEVPSQEQYGKDQVDSSSHNMSIEYKGIYFNILKLSAEDLQKDEALNIAREVVKLAE